MFVGFDPEVQARHEQYLIDRFGDGMREGIAETRKKVKSWTKADWERSGRAFNAICQDLIQVMNQQLPSASPETQQIVRRHYEWLKQFWTPNKESYVGHTLLITDSELRQAYAKHHADLPDFLAAAIKCFAERELSA
jgi:hypothetical protein